MAQLVGLPLSQLFPVSCARARVHVSQTHVCLSVLTQRRAHSPMSHVGFVLCTQSQNGARQIVDCAERGLSVLIFLPSGHWPFCCLWTPATAPPSYSRTPTILAGIPGPLTVSSERALGLWLPAGERSTSSLAHEEALVVLPTLEASMMGMSGMMGTAGWGR